MFEDFSDMISAENIDVVASDGTIRCRVKAEYAGTIFVVKDKNADIQPGDEIRRLLPNGKEEVFTVEDPKYYAGGPFGAHYQVKISRRGAFPPKTGGHYIHVSGNNSRVNVQSVDNSINITQTDVFARTRSAIATAISDPHVRAKLTKYLDEVESAKTKVDFATSYQKLIASAADHITILMPFLPIITEGLNKLT